MAEKIDIQITGMSCKHCQMTVEKALKTLNGVEDVLVDLATGKASVQFDPAKVSQEDLKTVINGAGYETK